MFWLTFVRHCLFCDHIKCWFQTFIFMITDLSSIGDSIVSILRDYFVRELVLAKTYQAAKGQKLYQQVLLLYI